jgi:phosphinothricin acetyltransferase
MTIRLATPADAGGILAVYARYYDTPITFEYPPLPTVEEFARRVEEISQSYPYLVAEEEGSIAGYAYAHALHEREAYQWAAECSIYLTPEAAGQGLGRRLYTLLLELLKAQGVRTAYGCVTAPNPASEGLHAALGFTLCGRFRRCGYKNGQWHDVLWLEKQMGAFDRPTPLLPFAGLEKTTVAKILQTP